MLSGMLGMLLVAAGCRTCCGRSDPPCPPRPIIVPAPQPVVQQQLQPAGAFPVAPGPVIPPPAPGGGGLPPGQVPSMSKSPAERNDTPWKAGDTQEPQQDRDARPRFQLYAPEPIDKEKDKPQQTDEPPLKKPAPERSFPAIPQFAEARENVYAGLRPPLEGLDWLQKNRVQTVVQVRLFGEDDSAVRKEVEARGMRYVAFEVSPVTLTKEKTDEFVKLIRDNAKTGLFVFDQDGSLAGSMWYLYLRNGEFLDNDPALLRARGLGLQTNRDGQHRDMWLAVQKLLSENSK
jgi:hypothetical protein